MSDIEMINSICRLIGEEHRTKIDNYERQCKASEKHAVFLYAITLVPDKTNIHETLIGLANLIMQHQYNQSVSGALWQIRIDSLNLGESISGNLSGIVSELVKMNTKLEKANEEKDNQQSDCLKSFFCCFGR